MIRTAGIDGFVHTHGGQENGLIDIIKANIDVSKPFSVAEIGVWSGFTALSLLESFENLHYVGVDPYVTYGYCSSAELIGQACEVAKQRLSRHDRANLMITTSEEAVNHFANKFFDISFVDGNHDYTAAARDLFLWRPKTKVILAGHDYVGVRQVKEAVDFMSAAWNEKPKFATGDVWYFILPSVRE